MARAFRRHETLFLTASALVFCFLIYGRCLSHGFVSWDDPIHIYQNPFLNPPSAGNIAELWKAPYAGLYIPATYTLWSAIASVSSGAPRVSPVLFHLVNLLLHAINGALVYGLIRKLLPAADGEGIEGRRDEAHGAAAIGALFFLLHPLQVEAVAWATGLKEVLSATFALLALRSHFKGAEPAAPASAPKRKKASARAARASRPPRVLRQKPREAAAGTLFFCLSALSKPAAASLPLVALALDAIVFRAPLRAALGRLWLWCAAAAGVAAVTISSQGGGLVDFIPPLRQRPAVALDALGFYLTKLALPLELAADYGRRPERVAGLWGSGFPAIALAALGIAFARRKRNPYLAVSVAFFALALLPTLGFVPFIFQNFSTVADHYAYFAVVGASLGLAAIWSCYAPRLSPLASRSAAAIVLTAMAFASARQAGFWKDDRTLAEHSLAINPSSWVLENNLAMALETEGRYDDAISHYRRSLALKPGYDMAENNLGSALLRLNRLDEVIDHYHEVLKRKPAFAEIHSNLGVALVQKGRIPEARAEYKGAIRLKPELVQPRENLRNLGPE